MQLVPEYEPLTAPNRIRDFELPPTLEIGGKNVHIPRALMSKSVSYMVTGELDVIRTAWISRGLAHIFNAARQVAPDVKSRELIRAVEHVDGIISSLIKEGILKDRQGPGAMSFSQANDQVPEGSIVISERSYDLLKSVNPAWEQASHVMGVRFPNLGPNTTQSLRLIVNREGLPRYNQNSLFFLAPALRDLLEDLTPKDGEAPPTAIMDSFYLNPRNLKDGFEGDGDGDLIYITIQKKGQPLFQLVDLIRETGEITDTQVNDLFASANKLDRSDLAGYLPKYIDNALIGPATYIIRFALYGLLEKYKDSRHPMHDAWEELSPWAIQLMEFCMDVRKGKFDPQQIAETMLYIQEKNRELKAARQSGDWFAKTVTSQQVEDVGLFIEQFDTLQQFVDLITRGVSAERLGVPDNAWDLSSISQ